MPVLKLSEGEAVKLFGPMSVLVKSGCIDVHGKIACAGERFVVHKARNYVATATSTCELDVTMVNDSQIQALDPTDPYPDKRKLALEIVNEGLRRVVVLGCVDCGKTSFTTMLYNAAIRGGYKPAVIDGDVGQADIGPPGFVSLGYSNTPVYWINELKPLVMRFVGDIKPQGHVYTSVSEVSRLAETAENEGFNFLLVDTDGWVRDEQGILHKNLLIEVLKPDAVVVLGDDLRGYFKRFTKLGVRVYELKAPSSRKTRTREERRMLRSARYREFLENAPIVRVKMDSVLVDGCNLFYGVEVDPASLAGLVEGKVVYSSSLPGSLNIYGVVKEYQVEQLKKLGYEKVKVYSQGFERGLYCAVGILNGPEYPCIVEKFDFEAREVVIRTKYTGRVEVLRLSKIKLTQDFVEEYYEV